MKRLLIVLFFLFPLTSTWGQDKELEELSALYVKARNAKELTNATLMFEHALKIISGQLFSQSPLKKATFDGIPIKGSLDIFMGKLQFSKNFKDAEMVHSTVAVTEGTWLGAPCRLYASLTPDTKEVYAVFIVFEKKLFSWMQAESSIQSLDAFIKTQMYDDAGADIIFNRVMDSDFNSVNLKRLELANIYMCQDGYIITSVIPDAMREGELHSIACIVNETSLNK